MARRRAKERERSSNTRNPLVTIVHKANVLSLSDGLFRSAVLKVAQLYPDIKVEEQLVDSMVYKMILDPTQYDVVVAPNLYGDIISDAAAALTGGLGLAPSANVGDSFMLVEPVHGSAPDIVGKGIANPLATLRATAMLLEYLKEGSKAQIVQKAINKVLKEGPHTADLGGAASTDEITNAVIVAINKNN